MYSDFLQFEPINAAIHRCINASQVSRICCAIIHSHHHRIYMSQPPFWIKVLWVYSVVLKYRISVLAFFLLVWCIIFNKLFWLPQWEESSSWYIYPFIEHPIRGKGLIPSTALKPPRMHCRSTETQVWYDTSFTYGVFFSAKKMSPFYRVH